MGKQKIHKYDWVKVRDGHYCRVVDLKYYIKATVKPKDILEQIVNDCDYKKSYYWQLKPGLCWGPYLKDPRKIMGNRINEYLCSYDNKPIPYSLVTSNNEYNEFKLSNKTKRFLRSNIAFWLNIILNISIFGVIGILATEATNNCACIGIVLFSLISPMIHIYLKDVKNTFD